MASSGDLSQRLDLLASAIKGRIAFSTSLGIEDQAILHAIAGSGAAIDVFTLDTGRLFPETIDTIAESEARFGIKIRVLAPEAGEVEALVARDGVLGFRSSIEARKACCDVRKVVPLKRGLEGAAGWVTGLRRGQSGGRATCRSRRGTRLSSSSSSTRLPIGRSKRSKPMSRSTRSL